MNARKLLLPLLVALGCVALAVLPAWGVAATHKHRSGKRPAAPLRIESIKVGSKAGPLVLAVRANVHASVALKVNGKRVSHSFESIGENVQRIELRSTDGLRAGSNKLRLRSTRAGTVSTAARNVRVPRWALLANAGGDTATYVDTHTRVGTPPPPDAARGGVDYSWRIVRKPRGATASLADDGDPQSLLRADDPGTYVLQEEANPTTPGEPTAFDQVNVPVAADVPPSGLTLDTDKDNAISIGGQSYGKVSDNGIGYAIVERTTGAVVKSGDVGPDKTGITALSTLADEYGAADGSTNFMHYLMILSGGTGQSPETANVFVGVMKKIGVALPSPETFLAFNGRNRFSIVGIPGGPPDSATTRIPGGPEGAANSDAITGYLQRNEAVNAQGAKVYEYVSGENPEFDTKAAGSTGTTNVMTVDGKKFEASLLPNATAGFHLVVLNSMTLQPIDNVGLSTNGNGGNDLVEFQGAAANRFAESTRTPGTPLVLVQSIGKPKAAGPVWETFASGIARLGGNPQVVNALNGTAEYAFVGRAGSTAPPAESTTAYDKGPYPAPTLYPAHLIGVLARSRTSNFVPNVYSTPTTERPGGLVNIGMMQVAYQPPTAWPELAPGANRDEVEKAAHYICTKLNFCQPVASCDSVRECFWKKYDSDWGDKHTGIIGMEYPGGDEGFTSAVFLAVKNELKEETGEVAEVHSWLAKLLAPLEQTSGSSYVDLQAIGNKVWESVQRPAADNSTSWILGLVGHVIAIGRIAPPPANNVAAGLSGIFGLASFLSDKSGQPILGAQIKVKSSELAKELYKRVDLARETTTALGMLITSDYGKLTTTFSHLDAAWSPPSTAEADRALSIGAQQWFYEALIPTAYPNLIRASGVTNARALNCTLPDEGNRRSWPNQPDQLQMNTTTGYDANGNPITSDFFFTQGIGGGASPPASLGDEMFRPLEAKDSGLGIEKLQFFSARVFNGNISHAIYNYNQCGVGWMPRHY
jgi:hypothetical protein